MHNSPVFFGVFQLIAWPRQFDRATLQSDCLICPQQMNWEGGGRVCRDNISFWELQLLNNSHVVAILATFCYDFAI